MAIVRTNHCKKKKKKLKLTLNYRVRGSHLFTRIQIFLWENFGASTFRSRIGRSIDANLLGPSFAS